MLNSVVHNLKTTACYVQREHPSGEDLKDGLGQLRPSEEQRLAKISGVRLIRWPGTVNRPLRLTCKGASLRDWHPNARGSSRTQGSQPPGFCTALLLPPSSWAAAHCWSLLFISAQGFAGASLPHLPLSPDNFFLFLGSREPLTGLLDDCAGLLVKGHQLIMRW